jgi:membrane protease YdiL (CAAX protease family)
MSEKARSRVTAGTCFLIIAAFWLGSVGYLVVTGAGFLRPVIALVVFGGLLPALAWLFTRRTNPPAIPVARPMRELAFVVGYLVLYAFYFLGWAIGAVQSVTEAGPERDIALLILSLGVSVSAPAVLLFLLGAQLAPLFDLGLKRKGFLPILAVVAPALLLLVIFASSNPKVGAVLQLPLATLAWAAPTAFVLVGLQSGFCEEFLFRAVLQTRLAAVLDSQIAAAFLSALLFALSHVPGVYLRGVPGMPGYSTDFIHVLAYSMGVMAPIGFLAAVIWARTRSLLLVVLVHAFAAFLPRIIDVANTWA